MIVWIASYPKSGSTWVRAFLSTYLYSKDGSFNMDILEKMIGEFPDHNILNKFMTSKDFHNLTKVSKNWIKVQEIINTNKKLIFLKTHSAHCNIHGNVFTNKNNTLAFIYIVRDPRNVILSLANHFGISQKESSNIIINKMRILYPMIKNTVLPATFIGDWENHYLSWKKFNEVNNIIIRYEDLINNTEDTFKKIIIFLSKFTEIEYYEKKLNDSVNSTQFNKLQKYEKKYGFIMGQMNKFFYLGQENNWQNLLNPEIEKKIRTAFDSEMRQLNYI